MQNRKLETISDFQELMNDVRNERRKLVDSLLQNRNDPNLMNSALSAFDAAKAALLSNLVGTRRKFKWDDSHELEFDLRDELGGLQLDSACLPFFDATGRPVPEMNAALAGFHPGGTEAFEREKPVAFGILKRVFGSGKEIFITDWDGTMKNYGNNYNTCMQPAYSALVIARFVREFARLGAVLTAGPLENPGILDLTAIPSEGWVLIGGSWGREWLIDGKRVVDNSCFNSISRASLESLSKSILLLVTAQKYRPFAYVGSGVQRKVDRITVGVQNVTQDVDPKMAEDYVLAIEGLVGELDPSGSIFVVHRAELDMEVILKASESRAWDKAHGVEFLLGERKLDPHSGKVLLCGDTESDLPMVRYLLERNPETYTLFVNPAPKVNLALSEIFHEESSDHFGIVSCPEVIHAAMVDLLNGL